MMKRVTNHSYARLSLVHEKLVKHVFVLTLKTFNVGTTTLVMFYYSLLLFVKYDFANSKNK